MTIKSATMLGLAAALIAFGSAPARALSPVDTDPMTASSTVGVAHTPAMERCGCGRYRIVRYRIVRPHVRYHRVVRWVRIRYI